MKQRRLGRGLDALLPGSDTSNSQEIQEIRISDIDPNSNQPRQDFDDEKLQQLAQSIKTHGVVQPIIVKPNGDRYILIAGERRWRASRLAGLKQIPAIVKDYDKKEIMEIALIENLQREDLNPIEEAIAIRSLMEEHSLTQEDVAERIGRSRSAIANILRLLHLPENIQQYIKEGIVSAGHARALLTIQDPQYRNELVMRIVNEGLSVREVEELAKEDKVAEKKKKKTASIEKESQFYDLESSMGEILGTRVRIKGSKKKGRIYIEYFNQDDLERIYEIITNLK